MQCDDVNWIYLGQDGIQCLLSCNHDNESSFYIKSGMNNLASCAYQFLKEIQARLYAVFYLVCNICTF
jgi:hypothetical protein